MGAAAGIGYASAGSKPWIYAGIGAGFAALGMGITMWIAWGFLPSLKGQKSPFYHSLKCHDYAGQCICDFDGGRGPVPDTVAANHQKTQPSVVLRRLAELIEKATNVELSH